VISLKDLSASIWTWYRKHGAWAARKVIEIPAEPAESDLLPPMLKGFGAVPPLVTDICRWMTASSMLPAGAPVTCANMMCRIRSSRS
jgi:hypothetical protein